MLSSTPACDQELTAVRSPASLLAVITIGFAGAYLFDFPGAGINTTIFAVLIASAYSLLHKQLPFSPLLMPFGLFFIFALAWRDSRVLYALNLLSLVAIILLPFCKRFLDTNNSVHPIRSIGNFITSTIKYSLSSTPKLFYRDMRNLSQLNNIKTYLPNILVGALYALPFLLVFGALLVSADDRYSEFVLKTLTFDGYTWNFMATIFISIAIAAPLLRGRFSAEIDARRSILESNDATQTTEAPRPAAVEFCSFLTMINALFLSYLVIQFSYFFGDSALVKNTTGLTYAGYARKGFFELTTVAALVLPLLWFLTVKVGFSATRGRRVFRLLTVLMVIMIAVMIGSALHKMALYTQAYGLTELRLYTSAFLYLLLTIFILFTVTLLRGRELMFLALSTMSTLTTIVALNIINPDDLIARTNLAENTTASVDIEYIAQLSQDAYPALLRFANSKQKNLPNNVICHIHYTTNKTANQWRLWTWSRQAAVSEVLPKQSPGTLHYAPYSCP